MVPPVTVRLRLPLVALLQVMACATTRLSVNAGETVSVTATGAEEQPLLVTTAKTVAVPEVKLVGFAIGPVPLAFVNQFTVFPVPTLTVALTLVRLKDAEPLPQTCREAGEAVGSGVTVSVTATGAEVHCPLVTRAKTITDPLVKAPGLPIGVVPAALEYQSTVLPEPPLTVLLTEFRLKVAELPEVAHCCSEAGVAVGAARSIKVTGTGAETQTPLSTTA